MLYKGDFMVMIGKAHPAAHAPYTNAAFTEYGGFEARRFRIVATKLDELDDRFQLLSSRVEQLKGGSVIDDGDIDKLKARFADLHKRISSRGDGVTLLDTATEEAGKYLADELKKSPQAFQKALQGMLHDAWLQYWDHGIEGATPSDIRSIKMSTLLMKPLTKALDWELSSGGGSRFHRIGNKFKLVGFETMEKSANDSIKELLAPDGISALEKFVDTNTANMGIAIMAWRAQQMLRDGSSRADVRKFLTDFHNNAHTEMQAAFGLKPTTTTPATSTTTTTTLPSTSPTTSSSTTAPSTAITGAQDFSTWTKGDASDYMAFTPSARAIFDKQDKSLRDAFASGMMTEDQAIALYRAWMLDWRERHSSFAHLPSEDAIKNMKTMEDGTAVERMANRAYILSRGQAFWNAAGYNDTQIYFLQSLSDNVDDPAYRTNEWHEKARWDRIVRRAIHYHQNEQEAESTSTDTPPPPP